MLYPYTRKVLFVAVKMIDREIRIKLGNYKRNSYAGTKNSLRF